MKIAYVASEVYPFSKTGGLADVSSALPAELAKLGNEVIIFSPKYFTVDEKKYNLKYQDLIGTMPIRIKEIVHNVYVHKGNLHNSNVQIYFIDYPNFFHRELFYTNDADEADRFILFSKAVIELIQRLKWKPDIIHCNDWQTGLVPLFIKDNYSWDKLFNNTATIFTIHNIGYQGIFDDDTLAKAEIKAEYFYNFGEVEHAGNVNFMKAGISFADVINTVSETYASELMTKDYSAGLDYILQYRSHDFYGILNGVDYDIWNPASDNLIKQNYSFENIEKKVENKKFLLNQFGMRFNKDVPLIGIISRLAIQKGFDLISLSLDYLSKLNCQWIILGAGEKYYEEMFQSFAYYHPEKAACYIGYNNELAHQIEAGADMFLMPSHYEPCGLNQIYSLKYGTVPIVRKTGGLADTVQDWDEMKSFGLETGNGFSFENYDGFGLTNAVDRALKYFENKKTWNQIIKNGMSKNFSWQNSAKKYIELYHKAVVKRK